KFIGVLVPRRLRADWRQEWEAELRYREMLLAEWERLDSRNKLDLLRRSVGAFWDALLLQPRRLEDEMFQDLRFGIRLLLKHRVFTAVAVLSLALGVGANTAIFSLINTALLKTLPVKDPQQLVVFMVAGPQGTGTGFNYPLVEQFNRNNHSFTGIIAASTAGRMRLTEPGVGTQIELVQTGRVSGNFFSELGVGAVAGRTLTEDDDKPAGAQPVAVISYNFWKRRFGLDPGVVGRKITLDDFPFTIVGVAPPGFFGFEVGSAPDLWWPIRMTPQVMPGSQALNDSGHRWLFVMARLKPGVSVEQARAEMDAVFRQQLNEIAPERVASFTPAQRRNYFERNIQLVAGGTGFTWLREQIKQPLLILMTIVGLVLLIACANVANLLLARAAGRRKEIAVRLAIGAGRWRLIRQLLTESLLLAALSGALGLLLAQLGARLLLAYLPKERTATFDLTPDAQVLGFTLAVSLLTGILFGLAPALGATRLDLNSSLKDAVGGGAGRSRLTPHKLLIVTQVALSLFLLVGAGLFVRSLRNLKNLDAGFDRENVVLFSLNTPGGYTLAQRVNLYQRALERLEALPGARAASLASFSLLSGSGTNSNIVVEGYANQPDEDMDCHRLWVGPKYFATMGIPLLQGRDFSPQELRPHGGLPADEPAASQPPQPQPSAPLAAVINQTMARYFFRDESPLGRRFHLQRGPLQDIPIEIIGMVKDAKYYSLREQTPRTFYLSFFQRPREGTAGTMLLRSFANPASTAAAIQRTLQELDPQVHALNLRTMNDVVDRSLMQERFVAQLGSFFSLFALLLASIGLYGVMSYATAWRTREIGIRMALGARAVDVIRLVMRETMLLVGAGVVIGLGAAFAATRLVTSLLFGLSPTDPLTIALAVLLILIVGAVAGYLPARRAARVDPMAALRFE
ncbi:MAG: ABC transporter permease, partial [Acidobacteria bacterium]|nr:ABC transporter permease [Acidobacteriota bacterium]